MMPTIPCAVAACEGEATTRAEVGVRSSVIVEPEWFDLDEVRFCAHHALTLRPRDVLPRPTWASLRAQYLLMTEREPDAALTSLRFLPLH